MFELENILRMHTARYPLMQPTDAVKLIYQNEFGGGHLIQDEHSCLNYLYNEFAAVKKDPSIARYEEIGNGIVRVNLAAVREEELQQLGEAFIRSAAEHTGSLAHFLAKLEVLKAVTAQGIFAFSPAELEAYLQEYAASGYPIASHSQAYRAAYQPAYRIVRK